MHHRQRLPIALLTACLVLGGVAGCKEKHANADTAGSPESAPAASPASAPIHAAVAAPPAAPAPPAVSPESARAIERSCAKICAHSTALRCAHPEDCTPNCLAMAIGTPCADEFAGLYRCLEGEPVGHWECAEDGVAAVREGYCEREQAAAVGCMEAKAR